MKTARLALLALVTTVLVVPAAPPAHAETTCHGKTATITTIDDDGSGTVRGTDGDDVIAVDLTAEHGFEVDAGAGDDTICLVADDRAARVDAGPGDDDVDTTGVDGRTAVVLGAGSDVFLGGPGDDDVLAGAEAVDGPTTDAEHDVISTGAGSDEVETGQRNTGNDDDVDLGADSDSLSFAGLPAGGHLSGGFDSDRLTSAERGSHRWTVDVPGRRLAAGDHEGSVLDGFEGYSLSLLAWDTLTFVGGPGADGLYVGSYRRRPAHGPMDVDLGAGADVLSVGQDAHGTLRGGAGTDRVQLEGPVAGSYRGGLEADLGTGRFHASGRPGQRTRSFESLRAWGWADLDVTGTPGADVIDGRGCRVTLRGGSGNDHLVVRRYTYTRCDGQRRSSRAYGGPGRDRCQAVVRRSC